MNEVQNPYELYKEKYCEHCTDEGCPVYGSKMLPSEKKAKIIECAEMNIIMKKLIGE